MDNNELVKALRILDDDCKNLECKDCPRNKYRKFSSRKGCCDGVNLSAADTIEQLTAQVATVTAERDAAISDLRVDDICTVCSESGFSCYRASGGEGSKCANFKWRGVQGKPLKGD